VKGLFSDIRYDLPASLVVFFVAIPLCLGIALASGAPLFAGLIAGVVGGIVVGAASGSALGVSGPAAGLAVIVLGAIGSLGSWEVFLVAVIIAGVLQVLMGYIGLGNIAYYFPDSVIKGMLTGIGLLIIIKQIPHALGAVLPPDQELNTSGGVGVLDSLRTIVERVSPGALTISMLSLALIITWDTLLAPRWRAFRIVQSPLAAVAFGMLAAWLMISGSIPFEIASHQMVAIPIASSVSEFFGQFSVPDFSALARTDVYVVALLLAVIASLETLLCVEATDRLDPQRRITPTNRELKAQGLGNIISGLVGGLPVTQVIVRSTANITFGGRTKLSAILHGILLALCVVAIPGVLNLIPLATLAAVLFVVGYKLAKPALFAQMYRHGWEQFVPFMITVIGIVATDLLLGIAIGMLTGVVIVLYHNLRNPFTVEQHAPGSPEYLITLAEEVSFLNKGRILQQLQMVPEGSHVVIDGTRSKVVDFDVRQILRDFRVGAPGRGIQAEFRGITL